MQIQETALKGVLILTFDGQTDARGTMNVTIDTSAMADAGISFACKEQRLYHMPKKGTFFGIHFQTKRHPQDKLIHLLAGRGMDYVIDLRRDSPTYRKWIAIELRGGDHQCVFIPQGFGHAFLSLEDDTTQLFSASEHFHRDASMQIRFDDPQIHLVLPTEITAMSDYDRNAPYSGDVEFEV